MHTPIKTWLGVTIIIIMALSAGMFIWYQQKNLAIDGQMEIIKPGAKQKACTQEAKICPDGSVVSRTGPNCEFAECSKSIINPQINCICEDQCGDGICQGAEQGTVCPCGETKESCPKDCTSSSVNINGWQTYRNEKYGFEFKYPKEFTFKENDSFVENSVNEIYLASINKNQSSLLVVIVDREFNPKEEILGGMVEFVHAIKVDNANAYMYQFGDGNCGGNLIRIPKNRIMIDLRFTDCNNETEMINKQQIILSTFKFIN